MRNTTVAIGVGSNLALPIENLRLALHLLKKNPFLEIKNVSSIYESDAQLPPNASVEWNKNFLNAVFLCECRENVSANDLLQSLKKIETELGRKQDEKWAPRIIDLDVLYWSREKYSDEAITIPHKHLFERPFALLPLLEVWPELKNEINVKYWDQIRPFNTLKSPHFFWPKMVGILNITEDSFSDGGKFLKEENLTAQVQRFIDEGTEVLDIGAESTRPGANPVDEETEFKNLSWALKIIEPFRKKNSFKISLDCRNPNVIAQVLNQYEIDFLNDVSGFENPKMKTLLKEFNKKAFVMHSLSVPPNKEILDENKNPAEQLINWWIRKVQELARFGIAEDNLIFDPGIGFGKSKQQSLFLLENLEQFKEIKSEVMLGYSRKSFLTLFTDKPAEQRDPETALITQKINLAYAQYLRVHNVEMQKSALRTKS